MPERIVWITEIEAEVVGGNVEFVAISGNERLPSCMSRSAARQFAVECLAKLDEADRRERSRVIPFRAATG